MANFGFFQVLLCHWQSCRLLSTVICALFEFLLLAVCCFENYKHTNHFYQTSLSSVMLFGFNVTKCKLAYVTWLTHILFFVILIYAVFCNSLKIFWFCHCLLSAVGNRMRAAAGLNLRCSLWCLVTRHHRHRAGRWRPTPLWTPPNESPFQNTQVTLHHTHTRICHHYKGGCDFNPASGNLVGSSFKVTVLTI